MDIKDKLIADFKVMLANGKLDAIESLVAVLNNYDVSKKCYEVGTQIGVSNQTMLKRYMATKSVEGLSKASLKQYGYQLRKMLNEVNLPIEEITTYHLRYYLAINKDNGLSDVTLENMRRAYSSFFGWLYEEGILNENPCTTLKKIKIPKREKLPFTNVEVEIMRDTCKTLRDRALIEFMLSTGCRVSEVCSVNYSEIDYKNGELYVIGKGNKQRKVYLTDSALLHINKYLKSRNDNYEALFVGKGTSRLTPSGIRKILHQIESECEIDNIHPHRFRRTLCCTLGRKGMSIEKIAIILGHENISTTRLYLHITDVSVKQDYTNITA